MDHLSGVGESTIGEEEKTKKTMAAVLHKLDRSQN